VRFHEAMEVMRARSIPTGWRWKASSRSTRFYPSDPRARLSSGCCNDIVDWMKGYEAVADAMAKELGVTMGETTSDGAITLTHTPCIG